MDYPAYGLGDPLVQSFGMKLFIKKLLNCYFSGIKAPVTSFANQETSPSFELSNQGGKVKNPFTKVDNIINFIVLPIFFSMFFKESFFS